jgi:hypothetical protein
MSITIQTWQVQWVISMQQGWQTEEHQAKNDENRYEGGEVNVKERESTKAPFASPSHCLEDSTLTGSCRWLPTFHRNTLPMSSGRNDGGDTYLQILVTSYKTTWHHNPGDHNR